MTIALNGMYYIFPSTRDKRRRHSIKTYTNIDLTLSTDEIFDFQKLHIFGWDSYDEPGLEGSRFNGRL